VAASDLLGPAQEATEGRPQLGRFDVVAHTFDGNPASCSALPLFGCVETTPHFSRQAEREHTAEHGGAEREPRDVVADVAAVNGAEDVERPSEK